MIHHTYANLLYFISAHVSSRTGCAQGFFGFYYAKNFVFYEISLLKISSPCLDFVHPCCGSVHCMSLVLDPDPDPLARGLDPDPAPDPVLDPSITKQKVRKTLLHCFVSAFDFLSLKNDVNVPSISKKQKTFKKN
jgi:hypothetical protein